MWTCPKCGRDFKRNNQSHYCGPTPESIDEYIKAQDESIQPMLIEVCSAIRSAIPEAKECFSWKMPTWKKNHNVLQLAANRHHIGLYPGDAAVDCFKDRLEGYEFSKGSIRLPLDGKMPCALIADIAKWCYDND